MRKELITEINRVKELMGVSLLTESNFVHVVNGKKVGINSGYGYRVIDGVKSFHAGLDLYAVSGTQVLSPADGTVTRVVFKTYNPETRTGACGGEMIIDHGTIDGKKIRTRYCHIRESKVEVGDKVVRGQVIALSGGYAKKVNGKIVSREYGAGNSHGAHLHWEVYENGKTVNPKSYFNNSETIDPILTPPKDDDKTTSTTDDSSKLTSGDNKTNTTGKHTWLDVKNEFDELKARLSNIKFLNINFDKIKEKIEKRFPNLDFEKIKDKVKNKFPDLGDVLDKIEKGDVDLSDEKEKVENIIDKIEDVVKGETKKEKIPLPTPTEKQKIKLPTPTEK
jgi:hypothetical protein